MATLREKLNAAIALQQSEVDRLVNVAKGDLPKAQKSLADLRGLLAALDANPTVETSYALAKNLGIQLDTE